MRIPKRLATLGLGVAAAALTLASLAGPAQADDAPTQTGTQFEPGKHEGNPFDDAAGIVNHAFKAVFGSDRNIKSDIVPVDWSR
ncbi:hypothetical protein [Nocardiopsis sp. CA-288880]|uniref:hypothetical protein n=1 Tax=Nocardiopsis sp. CA-288880 TaxID=3239995 RepID=UPI003D9535A8